MLCNNLQALAVVWRKATRSVQWYDQTTKDSQALEHWQVYPVAQIVGPVQPIPPHWPQWAEVAPEAGDEVVEVDFEEEEDEIVVDLDEEEDEDEDPPLPLIAALSLLWTNARATEPYSVA